MVELRRGLGFAEETAARLGRGEHFRQRDFQGHFTLQRRIVGEKDHAAPASAQLAHDAKTANRLLYVCHLGRRFWPCLGQQVQTALRTP